MSSDTASIRKDRVRMVIMMYPKDGVSFEEFDRYYLVDRALKNLLFHEHRQEEHVELRAIPVLAKVGAAQTTAAGMAVFEAEFFEKLFAVVQDEMYQRVVVPDETKFLSREKSQLIAGELATSAHTVIGSSYDIYSI